MSNQMRDSGSITEILTTNMTDLVEKMAQFVPLVNARKRLPVSGLLIQPNQVLTVDHGVEREDSIEILLPGKGPVSARLMGRDSGTDLALLALESSTAIHVEGMSESARIGQPVLMLGRPEPEGPQVSFGVITMLGAGLRTIRGAILDHYIATDATAYPGFSGGPLVGLNGSILGINTSGLAGGLSLAIPLALALGVAEQLANIGRVRRAYLGVRTQQVDLSATGAQKQKSGLLVVGVESESPAVIAGLMLGDILIGAEDRVIADHNDLLMLLSRNIAGKQVEFTVIRGGDFVKVGITMGER